MHDEPSTAIWRLTKSLKVQKEIPLADLAQRMGVSRSTLNTLENTGNGSLISWLTTTRPSPRHPKAPSARGQAMKTVEVRYQGWGENWLLFKLADDGHQLLFEYSEQALVEGLDLKPIN